MSVLTFKQVTKTFQDGHHEINALKATDFSIEAGEFIAIVGPSGSGKSTFLTIAGGLQTPSSGQLIIDGTDYTHLSEKSAHACVSIHWFYLTSLQSDTFFNGPAAVGIGRSFDRKQRKSQSQSVI